MLDLPHEFAAPTEPLYGGVGWLPDDSTASLTSTRYWSLLEEQPKNVAPASMGQPASAKTSLWTWTSRYSRRGGHAKYC